MSPRLERSYWPADASAPVLSITAGELLRRAAEAGGERTALIEIVPPGMPSPTGATATDRRWTYAQLLADAEACARWLLSRFRPGEHICLWAPNVPEWVIIQYGAALAGLVLVTANPALREAELRYVLRQSRAAGLIHAASHRGNDMAATARMVADDVRETISLFDLDAALASFRQGGELPVVAPRAPAQIQFTSGTTGRPKGALLHHEGLVTNAALVAERLGQDRDVVVMPLPLFHTGGCVLGVLGCGATRSTLVLPLLFEPALMLSAIVNERATRVNGVPTMLSALLDELASQPRDLTSVRAVSTGGAPVPPDLHRRVEKVFGCKLVAVYGQTELSPIVCATSPDDTQHDRAETAGRPLPQVEVRIADLQTGDAVPIGAEGEIQARGYQTMLGYFEQADATAKTLLPDGWLRTGDLGTMDERGYLRVTGRISDMIIRGGENIYPAELEAVLVEHEAIADVAIFGVPHPHWGETVAAALRLRSHDRVPSVEELRQLCRASLAPHKTPADWYMVESLPLTGSGKVQKFVLREKAASGKLTPLT